MASVSPYVDLQIEPAGGQGTMMTETNDRGHAELSRAPSREVARIGRDSARRVAVLLTRQEARSRRDRRAPFSSPLDTHSVAPDRVSLRLRSGTPLPQ
jgi:hypothetical protein